MKKNRQITSLLLYPLFIFLFACGGNNSDESPNALGWTPKEIENIKSQCLWQYQGVTKAGDPVHKRYYCDCYVNKITMSVSREDHLKPNDAVIQKYNEFGRICESLTKKEFPE